MALLTFLGVGQLSCAAAQLAIDVFVIRVLVVTICFQ